MSEFETRWLGAVLAGGRSTRMGRDKRFLWCDGEALIDRVARVVASALDVPTSRVVLLGDVPGRRCIPDQNPGLGPLGGIGSIVNSVEILGRATHCLVVPVDLPLIEAGMLRRLMEFPAEVKAARFEGQELPLAFLASDQARALLDGRIASAEPSFRSISLWFRDLQGVELPLGAGERAQLLNANTPQDWRTVPGGKRFHES
ncbi:MAG: NTP transferase domain-containing protein [Bdellovibrionales bacterium]|nr:NTP transferase domain-containing protein [Bdellovibrionales bacterium]